MPIPLLLLAGMGIVSGVIGTGGHLCAKDTNEEAHRISLRAQDLYDDTKYSLEREQNRTEESLLKLGYSKKRILNCSMNQFLNAYDKIKHIIVAKSVGSSELAKFTIDQQDVIELKEMRNIYSSSIKVVQLVQRQVR